MVNQPDDELWELLNRADAAMSEDDPSDDSTDNFDQVPYDQEQFGEEPAVYRNYSNGYGQDLDSDWEEEASPEPAQPRRSKPTQAQKAAQSAYGSHIRAYNADFVKTQEKRTPPLGKVTQETIYERPPMAYSTDSHGPVEKPPKQKKKHRFRFGCLTAVLIPAMIIALLIGAVHFYIGPPKTDVPIGPRKPGTSAILLCGADVGGLRTDTMMILYVDSMKKQAGLLSLPRDTYGRTSYGLDVKLNSAYGRNDCGEAGMNVLLDYVQDILGYRPDGYVLVELPLLEDLVDLMGGVDFDVPTNIDFSDSDMDLDVHLEPGMQHLDGNQALGLVRFRYGYVNQDLGRADTQKAFLKACMQQWVTADNMKKLPQVMELFNNNSLNSLNTGNYIWFGVNLLRCGVKNLRLDTLPGYGTYIGDQSYYVLYPNEVVDLVNEHYNPYKQDITIDDVHIVTE